MKRAAWYAAAFLSLAVSLYALVGYGILGVERYLHPEMRLAFEAHAFAIRLHIFAAIAALALGPFQFVARLRSRHPGVHGLMGRAYLGIGVLVGGLSGLYVAQHAYGGPWSRAGFTLLAMAWLYTGWRAYTAIRGGKVPEHRAWMVRNFALTFAAVTLRLYLPSSMALGADFDTAYPVIAWLCWVPNLALAQLWIARNARSAPVGDPVDGVRVVVGNEQRAVGHL